MINLAIMSNPNIFSRPCLFIFLGLFLTTTAPAQLRWEKRSIDIGSKPGQKEAIRNVLRTAFRFTNAGKTPITITAIEPNCGCVMTALEKMDYAPGESGEISVTFDLEMDPDTGYINRAIKVTTSDKPRSPTSLKLRIYIPETLVVTPRFVIWNPGEKAVTKEILVKPGKGMGKIALKEPYPNSDDFSVEIQPAASGKMARVKITPKNSGKPCYAQIHLRAELTGLAEPVPVKLNVEVQ
ncbi:MAG: DUF1573 domain-containing protein [Akkermansiaceae bacterium]|nr:DUF1573 domain-containing protein [Verrucomicrobiales bacterium]